MDLPSGRTHVVSGMIKDVFIPVNYTIGGISEREYAFFFEMQNDQLYLLANRTDFIHNKTDIINSQNRLKDLIKNDDPDYLANKKVTRYEIKLPKATIIVFIPGKSRFEISPFSNMGKRVIACASAFLHQDLTKGLSVTDVSNASMVNTHWKLLKVESGWYNWTYINGNVIATSKYEPDWFDDKGSRKFVKSEVDRFGNIICTLFAEKGRSKDVRIPRNLHVNNPNFDLKEEVKRLAPSSIFVIDGGRQK